MADDLIIRIPADMVRKVQMLMKGSQYKSPEEYILALIRQSGDNVDSYTDEEEKEIKRRLSSLGYE